MDFFPIFLDLENRDCLVVGGGQIAARKVSLLLRAGANMGHALDGGGARTDDRYPLVRELVQIALIVAAGVVIVPAAGMKHMSFKRLARRSSCRLVVTDQRADSCNHFSPVTLVWNKALSYSSKCSAIRLEWANISGAKEYFSFGI